MATHAILVKNQVAAKQLDTLNRTVLSGSDIDNGAVFMLATQNAAATTGNSQVWDAVTPVAGSFTGLWMASAPELVQTVSGNNKFRGIDFDPRNFYTPAGDVFNAFKPVAGDIVTLTADTLSGAATVGQFAYGQASLKLNVVSTGSQVGTALTLKCVAVTSIPVGSGSAVGSSYIPAYKFEVINN